MVSSKAYSAYFLWLFLNIIALIAYFTYFLNYLIVLCSFVIQQSLGGTRRQWDGSLLMQSCRPSVTCPPCAPATRLLVLKWHAPVLTQGTMMFSGKYEDLGLHLSKFTPTQGYIALVTTQLGFRSNAALAKYVLDNLKDSHLWCSVLGCQGRAEEECD